MCHEVVSEGVIGVQAGNDTTWSATQVGPRTVKAGLGGHDDCVGGVDDVVENTSIRLRKPGRLAVSELATISDFNLDNEEFARLTKKTFKEHHPETSRLEFRFLFSLCVVKIEHVENIQLHSRIGRR